MDAKAVPVHPEAEELAAMGLVPAGAYRNRQYAGQGVKFSAAISLAVQDILFDPQTSGGLLFALPADAAQACLDELKQSVPAAEIIGSVIEKDEFAIYVE